jgi:hypothetical protein
LGFPNCILYTTSRGKPMPMSMKRVTSRFSLLFYNYKQLRTPLSNVEVQSVGEINQRQGREWRHYNDYFTDDSMTKG